MKLFSTKSALSVGLIAIFFQFVYLNAFAADLEVMWQYTVRPGDNLITLGKVHLINPDNWVELQRLNHIKDPYKMPVGLVLKVPIALVKQEPANAQIVSVSGDAKLITANGGVSLTVGQNLGPGSRLITHENSKAVIKFADGTLVSMSSNSELVLDVLSLYSGGAMVDTKLRLQKGRVETLANPEHVPGNQMQIITPSAIAAVRGTEFRVAADAQSVKQETLDGQVMLASEGQEVFVDRGFGSYAERGKAPSPPIALLPAVDTSDLVKTFDRLPVVFDFSLSENVAALEGRVFSDSSLQAVVTESVTRRQRLVFENLADGDYVLNIRAIDKNGLEGYDSQHVFSVNARPFPPKLIEPVQGMVLKSNPPVLRWRHVDDAQHYLVEIARDFEFKQLVKSAEVDKPMIQLADILGPNHYFWRVASVVKGESEVDDKSIYSETGQFTVKTLPPKPDISQMTLSVVKNRIHINLPAAPEGLIYQFVLDNPVNNQKNVWETEGGNGRYTVLLKEFGKQVLFIRYIDGDGDSGPEAVYEFDASPE